MDSRRLLIVSQGQDAIKPGGKNSGTDQIIDELCQALTKLGWEVDVLAPEGSALATASQIITVPGTCYDSVQNVSPNAVVDTPPDSVVNHMNLWMKEHVREYDAVLSFAYHPGAVQGILDLCAEAERLNTALPPILYDVQFSAKHQQTDELIATYATQHPDRVLFCSTGQAATYVNAYGLADEPRIAPLGVNMALHEATESTAYSRGESTDPVFGWAGRITPVKGLHVALEAVRRYNEAHGTHATLNIMGGTGGNLDDIAYFKDLETRYADVIGTAKSYPPEQLPTVIGACDVMLITHTWIEAYGMILPASSACGTPMVATRKGSPSDIIREGVNGFTVAPEDMFAVIGRDAKPYYPGAVLPDIGSGEALVMQLAPGTPYVFGPMTDLLDRMEKALHLDRAVVRDHAEANLSQESMGAYFQALIDAAISHAQTIGAQKETLPITIA